MACRILQEKGFVEKTLVIAPIRPAGIVWPNQCHTYRDFDHLRVCFMHGKHKEELLHDDDYDIYVVNPEGLQWLTGAEFVLVPDKSGKKKKKLVVNNARIAYITQKFKMLVVDESTKFKDPSTQRFKILKSFVGKFKRRYILTGSARPKSLMDLFGQIYILDEGDALGSFVTHYRNKYFYPAPNGFDWLPQPGAQEQILDRIANLVDVEFAEGNVDLPELVFHDIWVDLPPEARKAYDDMEGEMLTRVESGAVVAANAAVASGKCRQIANGAVFHSDVPGEYTPLHTAKIDALEDLIEQLGGESILVTYEFGFDRAEIEERLKIPCISSGSEKKDRENIELFSNGMIPAVQGHPSSIALGIDGLQKECCNIAMVGVTWSLQNYEQVIDRVRRSGNKSKVVFVYRILARNTVDEKVIQILDARERDQNSFLEMLKELAKSRRQV